jgi:hypothetical protein
MQIAPAGSSVMWRTIVEPWINAARSRAEAVWPDQRSATVGFGEILSPLTS